MSRVTFCETRLYGPGRKLGIDCRSNSFASRSSRLRVSRYSVSNASGEYIDPDEPVVIAVPNPQWKETDDCYNDDEHGNKWLLHFHMQSYGGGDDMDDDGNECGHDGAEIVGMAMEQSNFVEKGMKA